MTISTYGEVVRCKTSCFIEFSFFNVGGGRPRATKIKQKNLTEVLIPGKLQDQKPKEWNKCPDTSLLKEFRS